MVRRNRLTVANYAATLAATILLMLLGTPVLAQEKIPWTDLSLEERTILQQAQSQQQRFQNLNRQQQQVINDRFQRFNRLSGEQQRRLRTTQRRFQNLPEARRRELRERYNQQIQQIQQERRIQREAAQQIRESQRRVQQIRQQNRPVNPN